MSEEVTQGWFSRLGDAIKGVILGFVLVIVAVVLLGWNEKRSVDRYNTIDFAKNNYVETKADSVEADKEGKLVHFNGAAKTDDVLLDKDFNVSVNNSYSLTRNVEMYQWKEIEHKETKKNAGGSTTTKTTYTYEKVWSSSLENSSSFHQSGHDNPSVFPYQRNKEIAQNVVIGAHKIPSDRTEGLGSSVAVELDAATVVKPTSAIVKGNVLLYNIYKEEKVNQALNSVASTTVPQTEVNAEGQAVVPEVQNAVVDIAQYQASEAAPQIGDVRITFTKNPVADATVIAKQTGDSVAGFQTKSGVFYEVRNGLLSAEEVFKATEEENAMLTWFLRGLGFILMWSGFGAIFKPISVLADVLPILGDIAETGISIISGLIAAVISLATIAIAWLFCRPMLAILLFVLMGGAIFGIVTLISKVRASKANAAPAETAETVA